MFRGLTAVSVDAKGRMTVPSNYRALIAEESEGEMVLTIDTEERCLLLYPMTQWQVIEAQIEKLPSFHPATRRIQRLLIGHASEVQVDKHGRILIPQVLREYAGLKKSVVLVGQGKKFEIWDETQWQITRESWLANTFNAEDHTIPTEMLEISL